MVGAYNILIDARQPGTGFELLKDNVKIIVNPINSCFTLSRYEYDVYDSEFNNFDGVDRGYLKNSCVQKSVSANVEGIVPFNNWQSILTSALIGGIAGGVRSGKFAPDWISNLWSNDGKNNSEKVAESKAELQSRLSKDAMTSTRAAQSFGEQVGSRVKIQDDKLDKLIEDIDDAKKMILSVNQKDADKKCTSIYSTTMAQLDYTKREAINIKAKLAKDVDSLNKRLNSIVDDIKKNHESASKKVQEKSIQLGTKVNKGEIGAELATFEFSMLSDDLINDFSEKSSSREKDYSDIAKKLQEIITKSEKELEENRKQFGIVLEEYLTCSKSIILNKSVVKDDGS